MKLKAAQRYAVEHLGIGKVLYGNVGSGKTITSLAYFFEKECGGKLLDDGGIVDAVSPIRLYVITTARKRNSYDWEEEAKYFGISSEAPFYLTVDSWNNIPKYINIKDCFFIFDEQRAIGHGKWSKSFIKIAKKNKWILLSATPGDNWKDYIPLFIANGFYHSFRDFSDKHIIYNRFSKYPIIDEYRGTATLNALRQKILVPMIIPREDVKRNYIKVKTEYDKELYNFIKDNHGYFIGDEYHPIKNLPEFCHALRKVANIDDNKIEKIKQIYTHNKRLIIFYKFDYELEKLKAFVEKNHITYGELNGHKHDKVPNDFKWIYLVQYSSGAEAWNCIETDTIVFYCLDYSYKIMEQAAGRIDRLNSPYKNLYYYYLFSDSPFDKGIWKAIQNKKNFNESVFVEINYEKYNVLYGEERK